MPFARNIKPTNQNQPILSPFGQYLIANHLFSNALYTQ